MYTRTADRNTERVHTGRTARPQRGHREHTRGPVRVTATASSCLKEQNMLGVDVRGIFPCFSLLVDRVLEAGLCSFFWGAQAGPGQGQHTAECHGHSNKREKSSRPPSNVWAPRGRLWCLVSAFRMFLSSCECPDQGFAGAPGMISCTVPPAATASWESEWLSVNRAHPRDTLRHRDDRLPTSTCVHVTCILAQSAHEETQAFRGHLGLKAARAAAPRARE